MPETRGEFNPRTWRSRPGTNKFEKPIRHSRRGKTSPDIMRALRP